MRVKTPIFLQNEAAECGATALQIVLAYHGCFVDSAELRAACGVSRDGVNGSHLVNAARTYGLQSRGFRKAANSLKDLKPPFIAFMAFNHFVVIEGFSGSTVHINDPAAGRRQMDQPSFERQFTGIVFTFEPEPTFKRRGSRRSLLSRLIPYIKASTGLILLLSVVMSLLTIPSLAYPALLRSFIDHVLLYSPALFLPLLLVTLLVLALNMGFAWLQHYLMRRMENQLTIIHAARLMWQLLHLPASFFTQRSIGDIASRFELVDSLSLFFAQDAVRFSFNGLLIGAYSIVLGIYHPLLPVLSGGLLVIYTLFVSLLNRHMRESASVWQGKLGKLAGTAIHSLQNIEHVKANGTESDVFTRLVSYYTDMQNAAQSLNLSLCLLKSVLMGITSLNTVIIFAFGVVQVQAGLWSISAFAAAYLISLSLWNAVTGLTGFSGRAARLETDINRLEDILHEPTQPQAQTLSSDDGTVEIKALTFGYKRLDRPLLDHITLTILSGKSIGLVGASGSGKTTLARLIAGVYHPQGGELQRGHTALVDQDIFLFEGTIRENLAFWNEAVSHDAILRAAQDAEIDTDIQHLPQAYNTLLTEHGRNLSGGQRQRVQIARALASDPAVLILDEATSALDPVLEERVLANIRQRGCTLLIVSHRWSAIQGCDEIWVMENGQIVERGTHDDLWQKSPKYTQLIQTPQYVNPLGYSLPDQITVQSTSPISPRSLTTALHMLTSLVHQPTEHFWDGLAAHDSIMAACTIIGREMGFAVHQSRTDQPDRILAIAEASHVSMRRVQLPADWWQRDCGPFIAHRSGTPMAFVRRGQHYVAADAISRQMIPINAAHAAEIETTVYQFYPALLDDRVTLRTFIQFIVRNHPSDWRILIVCGVLMALLQMVPAFLMGVLFDTALPEAHMSLIAQIVLALLTLSGVLALFTFGQETALIRIQIHTDFVIQSGLWTRLLSLSPAFFRQFSAGDLVMRVIGSRDALQNMTLTLISGVFYVVSWMAALIALLIISPSLAGVGLVLTAAYLVALLWIGQGFVHYEGAAADQRGRNSGWMAAILQGVNHLQIAGAVERVFSIWAERFTLARRATQQSRLYESRLQVLNSVYPLLALLALFLNVMSGSGLSLGAFMTAQIIFLYKATTITQIGTVALSLLRLIPSYQRLIPILNAMPETRPGQPPARPLQGEIVLRDVTFRYHAARQPALQKLSLHIQAGEFVAVVGASGSGKSTLLRVLLGFESPETGAVYYDQQLLAHVDLRTIRSQIGTVLQHHNLIYGASIFNNLVGTRRTTLNEAWSALRFAGLHDDIKALPMGIHTLLTEGGRALSAGQRQRLLIARAVVHHPRVLFFDEATSALDDQTQAVLINHLSTFQVTRVVIAHRLSTVLQADRIIVMDKGQIVESGTYNALMAQEGMFAEFARRQLLS